MDNRKVIYYTDELNDEFSTAKIEPRVIDENYKYIHKNPLWNIGAFLIHQILSVPIKVCYAKFKFRFKVIGKDKLKQYKKQGYFVYGNHTQVFADTFLISNALFPKINYYIVNPENVSMKVLGNVVQMLGAIPIPGNKSAMKSFLDTIEKRIKQGRSISLFPEAHIWPYYTKIRPFKSVSFKYPVQLDTPTFCVTNTYQSYGENNDKVKLVSYIDGPFFPDKELKTMKEKQENLRNQVYDCMVERSKNSNVEVIKYIKEQKALL